MAVSTRRITGRFRSVASLAGLVVALSVAGGGWAPGARAALQTGMWVSPDNGASVSGSSVNLVFDTSQSAVTFILPSDSGTVREAATVSNGVATGTFDSTRATNGPVGLTAEECDMTGCTTVARDITVDNPPAPAPTPSPLTLSPTNGTVRLGGTIVVNGSGTAEIDVEIDGQSLFSHSEPLPYDYTIIAPANFAVGSYSMSMSAAYPAVASQPYTAISAGYTLVVPDVTPPVISTLRYPKTYYPVRDGYLDHFYAVFATNEPSTAVLTMYRGGQPVSSGTVPIYNTEPVDLRAGDRLKPGRYTWQLVLTDAAGNVTRTPMQGVIADSRHTVSHTATATESAARAFFKSFSGSCSTAARSGSAVKVASLTRCAHGAGPTIDVGIARFLPTVKPGVDYGSVIVKVQSRGTGALDALNLATGKFDHLTALRNGTTTLRLSNLYVGYPKPEVVLDVLCANKNTVTVSSVTVSYVYKTLSK